MFLNLNKFKLYGLMTTSAFAGRPQPAQPTGWRELDLVSDRNLGILFSVVEKST